ncbi:MAG TPA: sugar ABC transporter permease [Bauldia sp.]|nr:sugar ABC transporter permease [Bauldia sp.]
MAATYAPRKEPSGGVSLAFLYLFPGLAGFAIIVLLPALMNAGLSLFAWKGLGVPRFIGSENYLKLLADDAFWASMQHTAAFILAMAVIPTVLGLMLAAVLFDYVSTRFGQAWASFFRAGFYLPQILPISAAGVLWGWILSPIGALNAILKSMGLDNLALNWLGDADLALAAVMGVMVWLQLGYALVVFMAGLARADPSLYEAAEIDGASWLQRLWWITVPLLRPEIFVVGLTTTIAALKVFGPVFVLTTGGPDDATIVPSYFAYYHFFQTFRVGYGAAITTVQMIMTIVLGTLFLRVQSQRESDSA